MMDARKMVALSSVMVASMANLARVFASIHTEVGLAEDGGGDFQRMYTLVSGVDQ